MLQRQARFRLVADAMTEALAGFAEVAAVALIGSVARPLWWEVPRFAPLASRLMRLYDRRTGIARRATDTPAAGRDSNAAMG